MNTDLTGKVAIITGAAGPQGGAIALALAAVGVRVALSDINPDRIAKMAAEIRAGGGQAIDVTADVASKFQCVNIVETTRAEWGRLDILVNAQSVRPAVSVIKMDEWEWSRCMDVNLKGTFLMNQLCGRVMSDENKDRGGTIINLTTHIQWATEQPNAAYAASMAGLIGFSRACALEYAPHGIAVNLLVLDEAGDPVAVNLGAAEPVTLAAADLPDELAAAVLALSNRTIQPSM